MIPNPDAQDYYHSIFDRVLHRLFPTLLTADQPNEISRENQKVSSGADVTFLYSCLSMHIFNTFITIPSQIRTIPYPHQHACVSWMCSREGMSIDLIEEQRYEILERSLHPLFLEWPDRPGTFYSPVTHQVFNERVSAMVPRQGGILCDTMGFGKTFEIIMLIMAHPFPSNDCENGEGEGEGEGEGRKRDDEEYKEVDNRVYNWKKCFALNEQRTLGELEYSHYEQSFIMPSTIQKINPKKCK